MHLTELLHRMSDGNRESLDCVIPLVYDELKKLARSHLRREGKIRPMDTTVLVHEAFLRLAGGRQPAYESRAHFYGVASRLMRQVLVDAARARSAEKRGAGIEIRVSEVPDRGLARDRSVLQLDDALRSLEQADAQKARLLELRYFGGLTAEEMAEVTSMPVHTVRRDLRLAVAWLRKEMATRSACPSLEEVALPCVA